MKCATEMVDGRLDMLKGDLIKDFKQEESEEEAGAGSFGIFTNPARATGSSSAPVVTSAAAKRSARNRPAAGSDPRVIAARIRKDTVKNYTSVQVLLEKALQVGHGCGGIHDDEDTSQMSEFAQRRQARLPK